MKSNVKASLTHLLRSHGIHVLSSNPRYTRFLGNTPAFHVVDDIEKLLDKTVKEWK